MAKKLHKKKTYFFEFVIKCQKKFPVVYVCDLFSGTIFSTKKINDFNSFLIGGCSKYSGFVEEIQKRIATMTL
jgi:hypothetical protein